MKTDAMVDIAPSRDQLEGRLDAAPDVVVALVIAACFAVGAVIAFSEWLDGQEKKRRAEARRNWEANQ